MVNHLNTYLLKGQEYANLTLDIDGPPGGVGLVAGVEGVRGAGGGRGLGGGDGEAPGHGARSGA